MNTPEKNNYIQYVNSYGNVLTKSVEFLTDSVNTTFVVQGIKESFFILGVFQNNLQQYGIGFNDIENNDMLAFINSNIIDLDCIPQNSFLNSEEVVTMSYNNAYVKQQKTNERLYFEEVCNALNIPYSIEPFSKILDENQSISSDFGDRRKYYYCRGVKLANYACQNYVKTGVNFAPDVFMTDSYHLFNYLGNPSGQHIQNVEVIGYVATFASDLWIEPR